MSLAEEKIAENVKAVQIDMLYRHVPLSILTTLVTAALLAYILWPELPHKVVLAWFVAVALVGVLRGLDAYDYRVNPGHVDLRVWEQRFFAGAAVAGLAWGAAAVFLFPVGGEAGYQYLVALVIVGVASGAVATYPVHLPVFYVFFIAVLSPLLIRLLMSDSNAQYQLGLLGILFMLYISAHARHTNRSMLDSFRLRYENLNLIEDLCEQKRVVERASQDKSRFIAAANHDIRQPLHALNLLFSALEGEEVEKQKKHICKSIHRCLESIRVLFDGLMDVSRLDGGEVVAARAHFQLQPRLTELQTLYQPMAQEKGLSLAVEESPLVLHSDPNLLQRILKNLVSNAIKYTDSGTVWISVTEEEGHARIIVADTGTGIPAEFSEQVFHEFFQIDNNTGAHDKGLGLGLAIVQRLADIIGSEVSFNSECGKGTRFSVRVPLGSRALVEPHIIAQGHPDSLIDGLSILVIDDEADVLNAMSLLLERWGCKVLLADSVAGALQVCERCERAPDVIVADYLLEAGTSGTEAIDAVNSYLAADVPAILVTGDTEVDRRRRADDRNYIILHKPIMPAQLSLAIERCHRLGGGRGEPRDHPRYERRLISARRWTGPVDRRDTERSP